MLDTSVLLAGLSINHEHHEVARPIVAAARADPLAGLVVAEAFARLRGFPFHLDVATTIGALEPWREAHQMLATVPEDYEAVLSVAAAVNLGGSIHDLLIAMTYQRHGLELVTFDRRQASLARGRGIPVRLVPT